MVINKRLKVGSFTVKNTNRNGKTAHSDPTIQNKITTNAKKNLLSNSLLTDVPKKTNHLPEIFRIAIKMA